jgi:hypothetical protein
MQLHKQRASLARIVVFVAVLTLAAVHPLHEQLCGTVGPACPPCVLTQGYAGPPIDANYAPANPVMAQPLYVGRIPGGEGETHD